MGTVIIAIDAVPYALFARLQRQGLFREFFPAARIETIEQGRTTRVARAPAPASKPSRQVVSRTRTVSVYREPGHGDRASSLDPGLTLYANP